MNAQTQGFDVIYEIDQDSLLGALENLVADQVAMRLGSLDLIVPLQTPAPANSVQHGKLQTLSQPNVSLALPALNDPTSVALMIAFPTTLLQLDAVPGSTGFVGVGALPPTMAGQLSITLTLQVSAQSGSGQADLLISTATPVVLQTGLPNLQSLSAAINLAPLVENAIAKAVQNAVGPLFPLSLPIPFGAPNVCGIGVRSLAVKLLAGGTETKPALGFLMTLLDTSHGDLAAASESSLTHDVAGAVVLSNAFLKELVCCLFRLSPDVAGLGNATSGDDTCCHWHKVDNVQLGSQRVRIEQLDICVQPGAAGAQSTIHLHVLASQSGTGWKAYAQLDTDLQFQVAGGTLQPVQVSVSAKNWSDVSAWAWLLVGLAAALGFLTGLVVGVISEGALLPVAFEGGVIGAAIGLALVGVAYLVLDAVGSLAANAISGVLGALGGGNTSILPKAITDNFGTISDIVAVDFDDLFVGGRVQPPRRDNVLHEGSDVVLGLGDRIDLDRGVIQRASETVAGFALEGDLLWRVVPPVMEMARTVGISGSGLVPRSGSLAPLGTARLVAVGGASFWSLTESALGTLAFPTDSVEIGGTTIVLSDTPYPVDGRVLAVRTTEARLAKCVAWRDRYEQLHLSYVTYNTPVPLAIASQWSTTVGPLVSTTPVAQIYRVSRTGHFSAISRGFQSWPPFFPPPQYRWLWDDHPLGGSGVLPDGTTQYSTHNDTLTVQTTMGTMLRGVLQLELIGTTLVATADINEPGTLRETLLQTQPTALASAGPAPVSPVRPIPPPIIEQLPAAFARGMGIPLDMVRFH